LEQQLAHIRSRNQELHDRVNDLSYQLEEEKRQVELKAKIRELEKIKRELAEKDKKNHQLSEAITAFSKRMEDFEINKTNTTEDNKFKLMDGDLKRKEWAQEKQQLQTKIQMLENSRKTAQDDLKAAKVKEQEMLEQLKKAQTDKDEMAKEKKVAEERTRAEIKQRERL
jgi:chromosome segregation ATPase